MAAVAVGVARDRVAHVGGVVAVVVDLDEVDMAVHEGDDALGVPVEGRVLVAGPAAEVHSKLFAACAIFRPETKDAELEVVS